MLQDQLKAALSAAYRTIVEETGVNAMISKVESLPKRIREQKDVLAQANQQLKVAKNNLVAAEGMLMAEITAEQVEENGKLKAKYSNDTARKAELAQRQQTDYDYQVALASFQQAEDSYRSALFDLEMLQDEFTASQTAGNLISGKLNAMAGR